MVELGHEPTVVGIARMYREVASVLVIDNGDEAHAAAIEAEGVRCVVTDTIMKDPQRAAALARTAIGAV